MAILSRRSRPSDSIPTSSMADIAFLLLIFFLVTTTFPKDKGLAIVLPEDTAPVPKQNVMHLIVLGTGDVEIRRGESQLGQVVPASQVARIWRDAVAENPLLIAAVKTGPEAAYRYMVDVLDQLQTAGATRVSLQMLES